MPQGAHGGRNSIRRARESENASESLLPGAACRWCRRCRIGIATAWIEYWLAGDQIPKVRWNVTAGKLQRHADSGPDGPWSETMSEAIDAYYWIQSDWAYFGNPRLKAIGAKYGLKVNHKPVDLATVYARTGGIKLAYRSQERKNYRFLEMKRFSKILDMPITLEPRFSPVTGHLPSFFLIAAEGMYDDVHDLSQSIMTALWVKEQDIEDISVLASLADGLGLDGQKIAQGAKDPKTEVVYMKYTNEAIARGVWGAPFYFFRDEPFWGQDRLAMLEDTIAAALEPARNKS